jgi:hypothetical protein
MRKLTVSLLCTAALLLASGRVCQAGIVSFTIDPNLSWLTASGSYQGFAFVEQSPGSMNCYYEGTIVADESGGTLTFSGGSTITALPNPAGPFLPTPVNHGIVDNYGVTVPLTPTLPLAHGAFRDVRMDIDTGTVTDGAVPDGMGISIPYYVFGYEVYYLYPGKGESEESDVAAPNTTNLAATLTTVGNLQTLIIPVIRSTAAGADPAIVFEGQWVGTRTVVPEPATLLLMGLGMIGLVTVARRKYGR